MKLRFLHAPLSIFIAEKLKHAMEVAAGIVHDIGKGPSLSVFKKFLLGDNDHGHAPTPREE